jgi:ketosteroid isomerase-like protein
MRYRFYLVICCVFGLFITRPTAHAQSATQAVQVALDAQLAAWNQGNIERFMEYYWKSDKMKFVSAAGLNQGWQATLDRYRKRYPGKEGMGKLQFEVVSNEQIDKKTCFVVGKFFLERTGPNGEKEEFRGWYSLVWQKVKGRWVIVADHTS